VIHIWVGQSGQADASSKMFDNLKVKYAPLLDHYALELRHFDTGNNAIWRVYVGPLPSVAKAQELCSKIKAIYSGQDCRPVIN
jgi:hypothetical protein